MKNKFLIIFLSIIGLFIASYSLAALSTIDPTKISVSSIGEGSVLLGWDYSENPSSIKQFKILWRKQTASSTEAWIARYPSSSSGTPYSYSLRGLEASTNYEWRIKAEAEDPINDSNYSDGPVFTTLESQWVDTGTGTSTGTGVGTGEPTIGNILENTLNIEAAADSLMVFATSAAFAVGPVLIIYAAFIIMTKRDDPTELSKAKNIILWTVISLSIILFAKGIPAIVKDLF